MALTYLQFSVQFTYQIDAIQSLEILAVVIPIFDDLLFFAMLQACRGDKLDEGQELPYIDEDVDELDAAPSAPRIPIEADILLSQATSAGK